MSSLFGVSAQTNSGIRNLAFLIYSTRSYCAYLWYAPTSPTLSCISTFEPGGSQNSLGSELRLTDIFGFGIPYILCTRLMHLLLECTSPTLSGISTHSEERVSTLLSLS